VYIVAGGIAAEVFP